SLARFQDVKPKGDARSILDEGSSFGQTGCFMGDPGLESSTNCRPVLTHAYGVVRKSDAQKERRGRGEFLLRVTRRAHEPIRVTALIGQGVDARVLNREGTRNGIDVRRPSVLFVGMPFNLQPRMAVISQMSDERINHVAIVHRLPIFAPSNAPVLRRVAQRTVRRNWLLGPKQQP